MSAANDPVNDIEVYVTKYALTSRGVFKVRGHVYESSVDKTRPAFYPRGMPGLIFHADWHVTEAAARQRVKAMASRRKAALVREQFKLDEILAALKMETLPMATDKR